MKTEYADIKNSETTNLNNLRKYGKPPFKIITIHGGPGAAGEMAPVAHVLCSEYGVLEPLQTKDSIEGQLDELKNILETHADTPVTLIGFSWGAWLSFIFAAKYPQLIKKLILISSGPFEQKYADIIDQTRLSRLNEHERQEITSLAASLNNPQIKDKNDFFAKIGKIISKADAFDPIESHSEIIDCRYDIFQNVWSQASELRKSGKLLEYAKQIKCPVIGIHGDYDPHPAEGVRKPLSDCIKDFRFILLKKCGHKPWVEKHAKDNFYKLLKQEL